MEQLALMWAAPAPSMRVRYDPRNPARAWPVPLLDALSRPLSDDVAALIEAGVLAILGAAVLWRVLVFVLRLRRAVVAAIWAVAVLSAPLWTAHVEMVADVLGVSRVMSTMVGRGLTNPVKLHRIEVEPVDQPGPSRAVRWSLGPSEGADLLARLAPPSPHLSWSDLLAREPSLGGAQGSGVAARFAQAVSASLLALPDEQLRDLLAGMCEPGRRGGITYMLRPALERLAADASRAADIRVQAKALANHAAICR